MARKTKAAAPAAVAATAPRSKPARLSLDDIARELETALGKAATVPEARAFIAASAAALTAAAATAKDRDTLAAHALAQVQQAQGIAAITLARRTRRAFEHAINTVAGLIVAAIVAP